MKRTRIIITNCKSDKSTFAYKRDTKRPKGHLSQLPQEVKKLKELSEESKTMSCFFLFGAKSETLFFVVLQLMSRAKFL